ncbi:hypothetical protein [Shewanella glacialimarina]|uniref:hypothetical protein n=1 Tax=Shewanella glacialimarina TaxID=2590884 RepID=UPI001CF87C08|nr:hypothetical protein [Shewanella glacialimarina]UCX05214.1 hypothetical protein FJ709_12320 [Shewanella glacialimarina]
MSKLEQIDQLTQHLFAQRKVRDPASDFELFKPKNIDDAFAVQQQMIELSGNAVTGWKCLVPLDNGQLIFAPLLQQQLINKLVVQSLLT